MQDEENYTTHYTVWITTLRILGFGRILIRKSIFAGFCPRLLNRNRRIPGLPI